MKRQITRFIVKLDFNKYNSLWFGHKSFLLGAFFLASALPISGIFFLFAIFISFIKNKTNPFNDKWNYPLFFSTGILIFNTINNSIFNTPIENSHLESIPIILGLFNWIPLFFAFWGFQSYLKNKSQRELFAKYLIAGSMPVLVSCILQYWFNIFGPFETLNGLIIWFQRPISGNIGVSGLFSNQNYTGFWLSSIWPFSIYFLRVIKKREFHKIILFIISFLILYLTILTNSRNSLLSILIAITFLFKLKFFIISLILILIFSGTYFALLNFSIIEEFNLRSFFPSDMLEQIFKFKLGNLMSLPRFQIWSKAIKLIFERPIFGWGASTFASVYAIKGGFYKIVHTHSMPLELAYNFGLPFAIIICGFSLYLLIRGWKIIFVKEKNYLDINLYWLTSLTIVLVSHINDISYYDGKISLLIWILLAGVKCLNDEHKYKNESC